ncbi:hypothetical protein AMTRI_Chr04g182150 [Amborella trichopoda]|uniref:Uncharacterized protein n=1 Tax=Amborella trichopoda TaxID=13333 RepID=U5CZT0_AMBTC|nr:hypothetical protein AMTR_s00038p00189160 [Amborella trichopoda]
MGLEENMYNLRCENQRLKNELSAKSKSRSDLEKLFRSLGKEKEAMAAELSRKTSQLQGAEEVLEDLRQQNQRLATKLVSVEKEREVSQGKIMVQEEFKKMVHELRSLKKRAKELEEENNLLKDHVQVRERERENRVSVNPE